MVISHKVTYFRSLMNIQSARVRSKKEIRTASPEILDHES
jgi:hypothetical protein